MLRYAREVGVHEQAPLIRMPKVPPRTMDFLSDHEYERLCLAAQPDPDRLAMLLVAGDAGLRKGEILDLEWGDLDLGVRTSSITVSRSVWHDNESGEHVGSPKSGRVRRVPMTDRLRRALLAHRSLRSKRVFSKDDGSGLTPGQLEVALRVTCNRSRMRQERLARRAATPSARTSPSAARRLAEGHPGAHGALRQATTMRYMHVAPAHHPEAISLLETAAPRRLHDTISASMDGHRHRAHVS